jgi:CDP-diacylglycerol--glycerol-3-phosphate 3-phosphatidyltransferase
MERPERIVLVIIGALFARWGAMAPVLWVLAVLSTVTIIHRISYTYQQTRILDEKTAAEAAAKAAAKQQVVSAEPGKTKPGQRPQEAGVV